VFTGSPPKTKKPPKGNKNPQETPFIPPSGEIFHAHLQKDRVVLVGVNLSTGLLRVQRIAFFEENVHMLYAVKMLQD
jgi:hypothetical protein